MTRVTGKAYFEDRTSCRCGARSPQHFRAYVSGMIFQEPMRALDPVFTIGEQISETLRAHVKIGKREARARVIDALAEVGIPSPERRYDDYPHSLSGGMQQRVMIAMALICKPRLLIADEPTTALDVTVQAQIIESSVQDQRDTGTALIFISSTISVWSPSSTRVVIVYAGQIVEDAAIESVYRPAAASLHVGAVPFDAKPWRARRAAAVDRRSRAEPCQHAAGLPLP